jgi:hypothetical protein
MPRYVEEQFLAGSKEIGLRIETRADGLFRVPHVLADLRSDRLLSVRRLGKPETSYRKITFYKSHLEMDQHLDAILMGPGHPLYAVVDEKLNEKLSSCIGRTGIFLDNFTEYPYRLHFFEMTIRGQDSKGTAQPLFGEVVAIREELKNSFNQDKTFSVVPADSLFDFPSHPNPPLDIPIIDPKPAADFLKTSYQMERRLQCQEERKHYADVCREYLEKTFFERIRKAQDRVFELRLREEESPDMTLARQRAENDLIDLERIKSERFAGLDRLIIARPGPVKHIASALVLPSKEPAEPGVLAVSQEVDQETNRRIELAAEEIVIKHETSRGRECEKVGHLKIGFDIRSLTPPDPQTGYRDPVLGVRRIEVKGRKKGQPIRLTTNEWFKATQLGNSYWLYVIWDPLENPEAEPIRIQNPAQKLDHIKREILEKRFYEIPAEAVINLSQQKR